MFDFKNGIDLMQYNKHYIARGKLENFLIFFLQIQIKSPSVI